MEATVARFLTANTVKARPHLADPYWTLHAAAALGDRDIKWPDSYLPGRDQLYRLAERSATTGLKV